MEEFHERVPTDTDKRGTMPFLPTLGSSPFVGRRTVPKRECAGFRNFAHESRNRSRTRSSARALTVVLALVSGSEHAIADRHCAPAMEAYWRARTILLQENQTCSDALHLSTPDFHEATAQARICGFMSLHDQLNSLFFGGSPEGDEDCGAKVKRILEFSSELQEIIETYHR